ncbi:ABC transporter ATP-binding protein [Phreatobacter aquaticus]|uniref:ABC transporter ATP-binding protein n=1 Tax=Phreatobacter aquaticus TaxID=2570229 RepID=A0A4D7QL68_9HYPH|nr:ABC transporter ATP-binding protein [Phreatobacter aquaticus]QCK87845.1 ABC transporter ATP-binding protein [Phreatobacter aquaticus]
MSAPLLLEAQALTRAFGGLVAVNSVTFSVAEGEIVGLIGPNGAGKTTVFNMLAGSMEPTSGTIRFDGADVTGMEPHDRARLGIARTFQITSIFPALTVRENVEAATYRAYRTGWLGSFFRTKAWRDEEASAAASAEEIMAFCDLADRAEVKGEALSYGAQRRLEVAIALATKPRLLLLDEPAAGLNPEEGQRLVAMIQKVRQSGVTVLLVEHHMRVVMGVCDRIVVLDHGTRIAEGAPAEVAANPEVIRVYLGREAAHA